MTRSLILAPIKLPIHPEALYSSCIKGENMTIGIAAIAARTYTRARDWRHWRAYPGGAD
jgi:hypothetical protein